MTSPRERTSVAVVVALIVGLALGGGGWLAFGPRVAEDCAPRLIVTVDPVIAPVVQRFADRLGGCSAIRVTVTDSSQVTSTTPADVWIPDSSLWLELAHPSVVGRALPLAASPLVFVIPAASAATDGPLLRQQSWSAFKTHPDRLGLRLYDPDTSATGIAALLLLRQAAGAGGQGLKTFATSLRTAQTVSPGDGSGQTGYSGLTGTAVLVDTEQHAWRRLGGRQYTVVYPAAGTAALDFPYAVLTTDPARQRLAATLERALRSTEGLAALHAAGLRSPGGAGTAELTRAGLADSPPLLPVAQPGAATAVQQVWHQMHRGTRIIMILDEAGLAAATRVSLGQELAQAMTAMPDDAEFGAWTPSFARPYHQLVGLGPLGEVTTTGTRRSRLAALLAQSSPTAPGDLDSAISAAFEQLTRQYAADKENVVLVLTAGREYISADLARRLNAAFHGDRPVTVVGIGLTRDADLSALKQVAEATEGGTFTLSAPGGLMRLLLSSTALRACDGPQCPG